ncbi:hypothetical protein Bbelb_169530 [Branchiostoma belcheri]|nr:hypothetical protein Bbelb_169530 [Branchiostoma belcheri]
MPGEFGRLERPVCRSPAKPTKLPWHKVIEEDIGLGGVELSSVMRDRNLWRQYMPTTLYTAYTPTYTEVVFLAWVPDAGSLYQAPGSGWRERERQNPLAGAWQRVLEASVLRPNRWICLEIKVDVVEASPFGTKTS